MVGKIKQKTRKYRKHKNKNIRARKTRTRTRTRNISSRKAQTKRNSKHNSKRNNKHNGGKKNAKKWSMKYKKSINCMRPKGFSQKQYCKYGRNQKGGVNERFTNNPNPGGEYNMENLTPERKQQILELIDNYNDRRNLDLLRVIISENAKWKEEDDYPDYPELVSINEIGRKALEKINKLQSEIVEETFVTGDYTNRESEDNQLYDYLQQQVDSDDYFRYM